MRFNLTDYTSINRNNTVYYNYTIPKAKFVI